MNRARYAIIPARQSKNLREHKEQLNSHGIFNGFTTQSGQPSQRKVMQVQNKAASTLGV